MKPRGFIALMSAIIISVVLLLLTVTGSLTSFFSRVNTLDAEFKERSVAAADACVEEALLFIANDAAYTGTTRYTLNALDSCQVTVSISSPTVRVQATSSTAVTNLVVSVDRASLSILSWQEVPTY